MTTSEHQHGHGHGHGHGGHGHGGHGHGHGGHGHGGHGHGGQSAYDPSNLIRSDTFYGGVYQEIIDWLEIGSGAAALEAGSGAGGFTALLAGAVGADGSVAALDVTPELLETAKQRVERSQVKGSVSFHEGYIQHLPFEDGRFDLVWSSKTIHHLPDQLAGVREVARVLKPGGRFSLREGGLRPRFLPTDTGITAPGLEDRLEVAFNQWFQKNVREGEGVVRFPHGRTKLLADAGLTNISAKTFMLELLPPFSHVQTEYMLSLIDRWVNSEERMAFITPEDAEAIRLLTDPQGSEYAFNRQDLHYMAGLTVYTGQAPS